MTVLPTHTQHDSPSPRLHTTPALLRQVSRRFACPSALSPGPFPLFWQLAPNPCRLHVSRWNTVGTSPRLDRADRWTFLAWRPSTLKTKSCIRPGQGRPVTQSLKPQPPIPAPWRKHTSGGVEESSREAESRGGPAASPAVRGVCCGTGGRLAGGPGIVPSYRTIP